MLRPFGRWLFAVLFVISAACSTEETPPPVYHDSGPEPDTKIAADVGVDAAIAAPDDAVHVTPTGVDSDNCGTKEDPCQTVAKGIARASIYQPQRPVAITGGIFTETVRLASGVHLLGGFNANFVKDGTGNTTTLIRGVITTGEAVALVAEDISTETRVDSVEIEAPQPTETGKSSYGVVVRNAPLLKLRGCVIRAANGMAGINGASYATTAPGGMPGQPGLAGENYPFVGFPPWPIPPPLISDEPDACALVERHPGGLGGNAVSQNGVQCIGAGGTGGASGIDLCAGYGGGAGAAVGDPVSVCSSATAGLGGMGGTGGEINANTCATVSQGGKGFDGCAGKDGESGADGAAGLGRVVGSYWAPTNGEAGSSGVNNATGGGGGGGGGGGECSLKCIPNPGCASDFGGTGGGGGSAGCFGRGGEGGSSGGGSFGVLIADGSSHIEIAGCTITTGRGGQGGNGGSGQPGGLGGNGGAGGTLWQEGGAGGVGGKGGNGGSGGSGGGGAGGPSVGIYVASGASPSLADNTFILGEGGAGGMAGRPEGNHGQAGLKQEVVTP